jgi:hypothetical protein
MEADPASSSEPAEGKEQVMGFLADLESARKEKLARRTEPWRLPLARLRGVIGDDGVERVTTQNVFDVLQIPQRRRGAGACRRLAKVMAQLGWTAVRVRGVTRGGYLEQVRGYARDAGIALSLRIATAHPSRRQTLRDASWAFQIGVEHLGSNTMMLLVVVLSLTVTLAGCGSRAARLGQVDDENCRRIVAERDQKDQFTYQKCRANLMRYRDQDAVADSGT